MNLDAYIPLLWAILLGLAFCGLFSALGILIGPKRMTPFKATTFECGSLPVGSPRARMSVKFYRIAILFLVFDIEAAFMYPWAVSYHDLSHPRPEVVSFFGFAEMLVFVAVLVVALAYVWRKKAIGWD